MPNCHYVTSMLSEYLEGDLPEGLCAQISAHLSACDECHASAAELEQSLRLCRQYRHASRPGPLSEDARTELRAALEQALARLRASQSDANSR